VYSQKYDDPPEEILSRSYFFTTGGVLPVLPRPVLALLARPNAAHRKLAEMGRRASSGGHHPEHRRIAPGGGLQKRDRLHGSVHRNHCLKCGRAFDAAYIKNAPGAPACPCGGAVKPDVVLYGEGLDPEVIERAIAAIRAADLLIIGGTSSWSTRRRGW
jgi:NAD-dependent deacetylase